jgi:hypothetical protein
LDANALVDKMYEIEALRKPTGCSLEPRTERDAQH